MNKTMKRSIIMFFITCTVIGLHAQAPCAARLGGSWFIGSSSLVNYQGQDIVTFSDWNDPLNSVNIDVYGASRQLDAQVRAGKLVKGDPGRFILESGPAEFTLTDGSTDRIICILRSVESTTREAPCQVDVWLDLFVPGTGYFQCDPETSNEPVLQMISGATFQGKGKAVTLN
jgi:hypothetical protein